MQEMLDKVYGYIAEYGISILAAILILVIGKWVAGLVARLSEAAMTKAKVDKMLASFAKNIIFYGIMLFVAIAALGKLGVQTTSFVAIIGAAGLAVGLALQGTLANFAAGVILIIFRYFQVGSVVETAGVTGTVREIQIFNTVIDTADGKKAIIPNSKVTGDKIIIHQ